MNLEKYGIKPNPLLDQSFMADKELIERIVKAAGIKSGETVLEIGFGTGYCLVEIAKRVGTAGKAYGIDVTPEMVGLARRRLEKEGLAERVELYQGDARETPYENRQFDAVYMAAALELFDTPDIPKVLAEIKRVLRPTGRLGVISMPKEGHENSITLRFYERMHRAFPRYASCRPIYVEDSVSGAGFEIIKAEEVMLGGLFPMKIVMARSVSS